MKYLQWLLLTIMSFGYIHGESQSVIKDPNVQVRNLSGFSNVEVSSAIDLYITQAGTTAVAVSASSTSYVDNITTEVRGNTLYIGYKGTGMDWNSNKKMRAYVSAPVFNLIKASGACDVRTEGALTGSDLEISVNGSSDFRGVVRVTNLRLRASGSSDIFIEGSATNAKIELSGSSDVKGYELATDYADINASGASDVNITVNKEMKVKASGSSDVFYKGNGLIRDMSVSGASDIKKKS